MASSSRNGPGAAGPSSVLGGGPGPRTVGIDYRQATKKDIRRVKLLAQRVGRLFYDDAQIILLDQLCTVEIIPAEVLAGRLGRTIKEVGVMLNKLLEDRLVSLHRRTEIRDPTNPHARPINKSYYFLSYPRFLKVIRWRMMSLNKQIQDQGSRNLENKGFICPRCGKTYDSLDVANLYDPFTNELCCDVPGCGTPLKHDENREEARKGQEKGRKFNEQCASILRLLASLEGVLMPHFDPEEYIVANLPLETWKKSNLDAFDLSGIPEQEGSNSKTVGSSKAKDGLTDAQIASRPLSNLPAAATGGVSVRLVGSDPAEEAAARKAREEQAARLREQNQLPEWHLMSTISGEATSLGLKEDARRAKDASFHTGAAGAKGKGRADGEEGEEEGEDDYYAQYAQLQEQGPTEGGFDEELEFEDVVDDVQPSSPPRPAGKRGRDDDGDEGDGRKRAGAADGAGQTAKKARQEAIVISDDEDVNDGAAYGKKANGKSGGNGGGGKEAFNEDDLDFEEIE
ncbi:hypothetical protein OC842_004688 [Tilletia horrida]|uniref:HTH TFE/IIEalpha-type domain-containing protein n=1 Tax=Tilletia horrida TaxID=155126 RepID=A0AAN6GB73_9BASI|nr:hypothetical protein OC842_004688 [Tilletia horrida]KAK0562578.1 hypothetical protein OC844_002644 [Tilletia horrida]